MKLEREPVFGHLAISHKPDSNPFDHDVIIVDSAGLQSDNWIVKGSPNRVSCVSNEDGLEKSSEDEIKDFVKESDYYMDKSVTDCELPELIVCYKESSCNTVKDICIDDGVPSQDKTWFETAVDGKASCTFVSPDDNQNKQLLEEQMDIVMNIPDGLKYCSENNLENGCAIPCDSNEPAQRGDNICNASDTVAGQETVQISSEKASEVVRIESPDLVSETEESNQVQKEALVLEAQESNCLGDEVSENSKMEKGTIISSGLGPAAYVSIDRDICPQNGACEHVETQNMRVDDVVINDDTMSDSVAVPNHLVQPSLVLDTGVCQSSDTTKTFKVDVEIPDSPVVSRQVQHCVEPLVTGRYACLNTSNAPKVDDDIPDSMIVSSQSPRGPPPLIIPKEECHENGFCPWPETSYASIMKDVNSDTHNNASFLLQRGFGESSFSAPVNYASLMNTAGPYSGNVSLRSESSTTSTRSFAFPVLQSEWNSSPVRMAKADRRHARKQRGWRHSLLCCRF